MRKLRLKLVKVHRGKEGEAMLVRQPRRMEEWRVFVYDFEPERIEVLRGELASLLDGELEGDEEGASNAVEIGGEEGADAPPVSTGDGA